MRSQNQRVVNRAVRLGGMCIGVAVALLAPVAALGAPPGFSPLQSSPATSASVRYVATNGSDSNPGTQARPWRSVAHAADRARPGTTIFLRRGRYSERVTLAASGRSGAPITLRSARGEPAVLDGQVTITGSWIRLTGLQFRPGPAQRRDDVFVYVSGGDHVEISASTFRGSAMSAIFVGDGDNVAQDVRILGNRIADNGSSEFHHGIYCGHADGAVIANNIVEHNAAFGIQAYPDCNHADIANNTIVANGQAGVVVGGDGESASDGVIVANNIIFGNATSGVQTVWEGSTGSGRAIRNLIAGNRAGAFDAQGLTQTQTLRAAPRFRSLARRDYQPLASSPAIGKALVALAPARDIAGRARGARRDLGAVELRVGR